MLNPKAESIRSFLGELGLEQFAGLFDEQAIDHSLLAGLTDQDLKDIGVSQLGHRKRLLEAAAKLQRDHGSEGDTLRAERRQLSVMFVDLVGSTEIAAQLDPEDMRDLIHGFYVTVSKEVSRFGGHIAQFLGDGVLVYFGWPNTQEDAAERAVRAAMPIAGAIRQLKTAAQVPVQARIGIATGMVVIGGPQPAMLDPAKQAAIGDAPNVAARLQTVAPPGGIVISEATRKLLGDMFILRRMPPQQLKGLADDISMFEVLGERPLESRFGAMHGSTLAELAGRGPEMTALLANWQAAAGGTARTIVLRGAPGIGKSRIVEALVEATTSPQRLVIRYQCSPYHGDLALYPAISQITLNAAIAERDSEALKLTKLKRALAEVPGVSTEALTYIAALLGIREVEMPVQETPVQRRNRTLQTLIDMLADHCRQRPVLWIVEDLHWCDPTTIELISMAAARLDRARILILITTRPKAQLPAVAAGLTIIDLGRLDNEATRQIVARSSQGQNLPGDVVDDICQRTDGIPLFIEEFTKAIVESIALNNEGEVPKIDRIMDLHAIPATLHDTLVARLGRSPEVKEVAQIAAVVGKQFDYRTLASLFPDQQPGKLSQLLDALERSELIFRQGTPPDADYVFKHALVRDAAYNSLLKQDRIDLHQRLLPLLEQRGSVSPAVKAQHAEAAGRPEKAIDYWELAASDSLARPAYREAVKSLRNCVRLCACLPESDMTRRRQFGHHLKIAQALLASQGYSALSTLAAFEDAMAIADQLDDATLQLPALFGIWAGKHVSGQAAPDIARRVMAIAGAEDMEGPRLVGLRMVGLEHFYEGRFAECLALVKASYHDYDPARHRELMKTFSQDPRAAAGNYLAWALWFLGRSGEADAVIEENIKWARELDHPHTMSLVLCYSGCAANIFLRRPERVLAAALEGLALAEGASHALWRVWSLIHHGWAVSQSDPGKGLAEMDAGIEECRHIGARRLEPFHLSLAAEMRARAGDHKGAADAIGAAFEAMALTRNEAFASELHRVRALTVQLAGGPVQSAETHFRRALEVATRQGALALQLRAARDLAGLLAGNSRGHEAEALLSPVVRQFSAAADTADLREARTLLADIT